MSDELHDDRQPGWYFVDNALLDEYGPKIGAIGIAVYSALARHSNKARVSWPSYSKMAVSLKLSRPTVIATVKVLVEHGLIAVETVKQDGKRPFNRYTLVKVSNRNIGKGDEPVKEIYQSTGKGGLLVNDVSSIGKADLPVMVKDVYSNNTQLTRPKEQDPIKPPVTNVTSPTPKNYPDDFETWWRACPPPMRRCGKGDAYDSWRKAKARPPLEDMLVVLTFQTESFAWAKEGGKYIPMATTYLNRSRWDAEADAFPRDGPAPTNGNRPVTITEVRQENGAAAFAQVRAIYGGESDGVPDVRDGNDAFVQRVEPRPGASADRRLLGAPERKQR